MSYKPFTFGQWNDQERKKARRKLGVCFHCAKYFRGSSHVVMTNLNDNLPRKFHKACSQELLRDEPMNWTLSISQVRESYE